MNSEQDKFVYVPSDSLGSFFKICREDVGVSQAAMAKILGGGTAMEHLTASTIGQIEAGTRPIAEDVVPIVAKFFGIEESELTLRDPGSLRKAVRRLSRARPDLVYLLNVFIQAASTRTPGRWSVRSNGRGGILFELF